jgi:ActR/RegA family two-component response regulator
MRIVIVDREPVFLAPLIKELEREQFEVYLVENIPGVLSFMKTKSLQFLVGDSSVVVDHTLGVEVLRLYPLVRLIVFASKPSIMGMLQSISRGVTDYLPREEASFSPLVDIIVEERNRIMRWQYALLSETLGVKGEPREK